MSLSVPLLPLSFSHVRAYQLASGLVISLLFHVREVQQQSGLLSGCQTASLLPRAYSRLLSLSATWRRSKAPATTAVRTGCQRLLRFKSPCVCVYFSACVFMTVHLMSTLNMCACVLRHPYYVRKRFELGWCWENALCKCTVLLFFMLTRACITSL